MKLKGKQLKRVKRYRSGDPFRRKVVRFKHAIKNIRVPAARGLWGQFDTKKQLTQPLPATIDMDTWNKEFDAMALYVLFGVPYEMYQASQTINL